MTSIVTITEPTALVVTMATVTNTSCFGTYDGTISVLASGGTGIVSYNLQPTNQTNSTGTWNGLNANCYTIIATDANACTATTVSCVTQPPPSVFIDSIKTTDESCFPGMDGTIEIFASGAATPLQYSVGGPPQISNLFTNLSASIYNVLVSDANNCNVSTVTPILFPNQPSLTTAVSNANPCDVDTIIVSSFSGTPPYSYNLMPGAINNTTGQYLVSTSGSYTVTATDVNGCSSVNVVNLITTSPILTSFQANNPSCGQSDGSINPITYILNPGNLSNTTGVFNNLAVGSYTLSAQVAACSTSSGILLLFTLTGKLNPYPLTNTPNSFTGTVPTNGTTPYAYSLNGNNIALPQSGLRCTGVDTFKITDAGACTFDTVFNFVAGNSFPAISLNKNITPSTCALTNDGQIVFAPSAPLTFDWLANTSVLGSNASSLNGLTADTYVVKLTNAAGDCIQDTSLVTAIGTNCGNIIGTAYFDTMINCMLDNNETRMPNATVTLNPGNVQRITNANGEYEFLGLSFGNYTVSVDTNYALSQFPICSNVVYDTLSSTNVSDTIDFAYATTTNVDLYCTSVAIPKASAAPLFSVGKFQNINYSKLNYTANNIPVTLYAVMDSIKHFHSATIVPTSINGDTLVWTISNLLNVNNIGVYFDSLQALMIGDTIPFKCWIVPNIPVAGNNMSNDTSDLNLPIVTSYDPNDKQVSPQGIGTPGFIELTDSTLSYLVRFQNTGNAMAYNISIADTFSNRLDINSFQVLNASHPYTIEMDNNALRFKFDNIMLPDSNADEPNSHGYILYQIKQSASNILGDVINNTAHIYFDFNSAVVTNTTTNTIGLPVGIESVVKNKQFKIYPNPVQDKLIVQALNDNKIKSIVLTDMLGKRIDLKIKYISSDLLVLDTQHLTKGIYLLNLNGSGIKLIKK